MARKTKRTCTEAHHIGLAIVQNFAYYRSALRGIRRFIESRPQWSVTSLTPTPEALQGRSRHRPEGVIASVTSVPMGQALANWKRPVVNISAALPSPQFHWVNVNNTEIGQLAVDHFLELGLRRFAYVGSPDHLFSTQREQAFRQAAQRTGHEVNLYKVDPSKWVPLLDSSGGPDPAFGQQWDLDSALARWLRQLPKPIGIFVPLDSWGVQVAEACRRAEVRIPEEVALLGVGDDDLYCELTRPALSSIILPSEQVGYEAAALMERLLSGETTSNEPLLLSPLGLNIRASTEVLAIDDPSLTEAIRFIRNNVHQGVTIQDILQRVPIGRRTLERRCLAAFGWGLGEEIRRTRLQRACRLLSGTDLKMQAVATLSGFSDFRYLALVCRKELGMSPTAYRDRMKHS